MSAAPRITALLLLAFQALFLNFFLPAHTRGLITLSAQKGGGGGGDTPSCCESEHHPSRPVQPTQDQKRDCAVCYLASIYIPVDPVRLYQPHHDWVRLAHEHAVAQVRSLGTPLPFWSTAPPQDA